MPNRKTPPNTRLPRGRHGLPREVIVEQQRNRLLEAVRVVASEKGFGAMRVEDIATEAGVSRKTFYENFHDKTDCFMASYHAAAQELLAAVAAVASTTDDWRERSRLILGAALRHLAERPDATRMGIVEAMAAGPQALAQRDSASKVLQEFGRPALEASPPRVPELALEMTMGAVFQLIYSWTLNGRAEQLEELADVLAWLASLANQLGLSMSEAVDRYAAGCPKCATTPCTCP